MNWVANAIHSKWSYNDLKNVEISKVINFSFLFFLRRNFLLVFQIIGDYFGSVWFLSKKSNQTEILKKKPKPVQIDWFRLGSVF